MKLSGNQAGGSAVVLKAGADRWAEYPAGVRFFILSACLLLLFACSNEDGEDDGSPDAGAITIRESGWQGESLRGKRNGIWERFVEGAVRERRQYVVGQQHGRSEEFFGESRVNLHHYWESKAHGVFATWAVDSGELSTLTLCLAGFPVANLDVAGERAAAGAPKDIWPESLTDGDYLAYSPDKGTSEQWPKFAEGTMQNGWPHGRWTIWEKDGDIDEELSGLYEEGRRVGK